MAIVSTDFPRALAMPQDPPLAANPYNALRIAADFIKRGVEKGPALGAALRAAETAWIAAGFPGNQASLDRIVTVATHSSAEKPQK